MGVGASIRPGSIICATRARAVPSSPPGRVEERGRAAVRGRRGAETDGGHQGEGSCKKWRSWRADLKDVWKGRCWREGSSSPKGGVDLRKSSLLDVALLNQKCWLVSNMAPSRLVHLSFCHEHFLTKLFHLSAVSQRSESTKSPAWTLESFYLLWQKRQMRFCKYCLFLIVILHLWQSPSFEIY